MHVLCDTSSVLMLLRIAPEMFTDPRYECVMTQTVYAEFVRTKKLKHKYPWRSAYKKCLKSIGREELENGGCQLKLEVIRRLNDSAIRPATGRRYDLSRADMEIAAATVALGSKITTGDKNLAAFLIDQFDTECVSPLGLVNLWLEGGLITWNNERQAVIDDWIGQREHTQPPQEIRRFERLTGRTYPT